VVDHSANEVLTTNRVDGDAAASPSEPHVVLGPARVVVPGTPMGLNKIPFGLLLSEVQRVAWLESRSRAQWPRGLLHPVRTGRHERAGGNLTGQVAH